MKRVVRLSAVLAALSILVILIAACGGEAKSTPVLREEIFEIRGPITARAFGVEEVTLVTSDGQKWPVSMLSNVQVHKSGVNYNRTSTDGFLTAKLMSLDEYNGYKGENTKPAIFYYPMEFSFNADFVQSDLPVNLTEENSVVARAREASVCIFCARNWEVGRFPLADYLFELDDASYRREIHSLVLQVLDILFKGSGPAESN